MTQTAIALSTDRALNIHESPAFTPLAIATPKKSSSVSPKNQESSNEKTVPDGTFYKTTSQLRYGDKVKISFAINETYRTHFILIKGLLEFHRTPAFVLSYNKQDGTFDVTTGSVGPSQSLDELNRFLKKIGTWLEQEISFKRHLKEMIAFEREYRTKLAKVYGGGDGFTLLRPS